MIKRLELIDPDSCLNKAMSDEPVFVLRAKDPIAVMTIRHWATMSEGVHDEEKLQSAGCIAEAMREWRRKNVPQPVESSNSMRR